jgi:hypothetical protein
MTKEEFDNIIKEQRDIKNVPNTKLIEYMDVLSNDFEVTKNQIINLTFYMDKVEELYNKILAEYQLRNNE